MLETADGAIGAGGGPFVAVGGTGVCVAVGGTGVGDTPAEGVQDDIAGVGGGADGALVEGEGLLRGVAGTSLYINSLTLCPH